MRETDWRTGDIVRLRVLLGDLPDVPFMLLHVEGFRAVLCPCEVDGQTSELRATDRFYRLNVYDLNACFERLLQVPAPAHEICEELPPR